MSEVNNPFWIPATEKPGGWERKVLLWVETTGWCNIPVSKPVIGWWKHGPACFAFDEYENANHIVKYWREIPEPEDDGESICKN